MLNVKIVQENFRDEIKIYLMDESEVSNGGFYTLNDSGSLQLTEFTYPDNDDKDPILPLFSFRPGKMSRMRAGSIFQALADGLKDFGYVAEVDNKLRIVAEAKAAELEKSLLVERARLDKILEKVIK